MDYKDYYKILGLNKTATAADIKKTYKKLALKFHPDRNAGDKTAEAKFKEINEANQVLGNVEKRKKYDELGDNWDQYQPHSNSQGGFNRQQSSQGTGAAGYGGFQQDESQFADFFESFFGGNAGFGGQQRGRPRAVKGDDLLAEISVTLREAFSGANYPVNINGSKINMKLKPGLSEGQRLRIKEKGDPGRDGGANGDLIITVHIKADNRFERKGNDLYFDQAIDLYTAILGGKIEVVALDKTVRIDVPSGTDSNKTIRLKKMGMPVYGKSDERGDSFVRLVITVPKNLTVEQLKLIEQLRSSDILSSQKDSAIDV